MLDWLIVGGGLHGTYLSLWLTGVCGVRRDKVRVLDPFEDPLARWKHCTRNTGVDVMRSPLVHHIDPDAGSLHRFAERRYPGREDLYTGRYRRPTLALFEEHTESVIERNALRSMRVRGSAKQLARVPHGIRVESTAGALEAREVVLAVGLGSDLHVPSWARRLDPARTAHVFDDRFKTGTIGAHERVAIVGGGMSAAQCAIELAQHVRAAPLLVTRHATRVARFDQDPCWFGPKCLADFARIGSPDERRATVETARLRGSMPAEVAARLHEVVEEGRVARIQSSVLGARDVANGVELDLEDGKLVRVDRLVLATGVEQRRPGGAWIDAAVEDLGLETAACGSPLLDPTLRWAPNLRAVGGLAELVVGPSARNLAGIRIAAARLTAA